MNKKLKFALVATLAAAAAGVALAYLVNSQISRHGRDLFNPRALRRLAALGHMGRESASVDNIRLLRDFIAWEPRKLLRERARAILVRMETEASATRFGPGAKTA